MSIIKALKSGHPPSLFSAFLHFDISFMIWVLIGALGIYISKDLGLNPAEKGLLVAIPILGGSIFRIIMGVLVEKFGPKKVGTISMFFVLIPLMLGWLWASNMSQLMLVGLLLGVAGASFVVSLPLASRWYPPEHQGMAMGIAGAGNSGTVISVFFAPRIAEAMGWHMVFAIAMVPVIITALVFLFLAKESPNQPEPKPLRDYLKAFGYHDVWWLNTFYFVTFGGFVGMASYLGILLKDQYHLTPITAMNFVAVCVILGSLFRPIGGYIADRVGGVNLLSLLYTLLGITFLVLSTLPEFPVAIVMIFFIMSFFGMGNGAVFQIVPQRFGAEIGMITGIVGAAGGLGGFYLPTMLGYLKLTTGTYATGFMTLGITALSALFLLLFVYHIHWKKSFLANGHHNIETNELATAKVIAEEK